ncbi:MAG: HAD family hydrolase [Pseudomonadota bacterium]
MYRGIIFDKDGTLTDFRATWGQGGTSHVLARLADGDDALFQAMTEALGHDPETGGFIPESPAVTGPSDKIIDSLVPHLPQLDYAGLKEKFEAYSAEVPQVTATDLPPLFEAFAEAGHVLGIVTNDTEISARGHLEAFGIAQHVAFVAGADSGYGIKPDPGPILAFCRATGIPPEASVMVGDTGHDLKAGRAAGTATIGVLTGMTPADRLAPLADGVLADISHLPAWLSQNTPFAT